MTNSSTPVHFAGVTPILRVSDLERSLAFYTEKLGFSVGFRLPDYAGIGRGNAHLMLSQGEQGHPGTWVWFAVSDADVLHQEFVARGVEIRLPPGNYPWGSREMHIADPDGHVLRFASDAKPGEPLGDWVDDRGVLWKRQPDGSWKRAE